MSRINSMKYAVMVARLSSRWWCEEISRCMCTAHLVIGKHLNRIASLQDCLQERVSRTDRNNGSCMGASTAVKVHGIRVAGLACSLVGATSSIGPGDVVRHLEGSLRTRWTISHPLMPVYRQKAPLPYTMSQGEEQDDEPTPCYQLSAFPTDVGRVGSLA